MSSPNGKNSLHPSSPLRHRADLESCQAADPKGSVVEEFERQVDRDPNRPALVFQNRRVTFAQLESTANAVANWLIAERGSEPEPVPLLIQSPELMLAAAIGVMKAGKFYSAINPRYPLPRIKRMLTELDARTAIHDEAAGKLSADWMRLGPKNLLFLNSEVADAGYKERPALRFDGDRLAYVLYTSGSTGRPTGYAHSRAHMLHNLRRHLPLAVTSGDCLTLISADGFVASVSNPFLALASGAALAPYSFRAFGVETMTEWLVTTEVTVLYGFPSFLRQVAATARGNDPLNALRLVYLGGETVVANDLAGARRLFPAASLCVGLNSTETGLTCLQCIEPDEPLPDPVPVGRPVLDVEIEVSDEYGNPLPAGKPGELVVRSPFVQPHRWGPKGDRGSPDNAGAFRTGDRVRVDEDGRVFHLGRIDSMIKIRGYRVEPAEVENAIASVPSIQEVVVVGSMAANGETELHAYLVPDTASLDESSIRSALAQILPNPMIPTKLVMLDSLPRLANGKVDRRNLTIHSRPAGRRASGGQPAQDSVEKRIAAIWASVLDVEEIDREDDFFALGGTSISALSVVSRVRCEFGAQIPLARLFEAPTVAALAASVAEASQIQSDSGSGSDEIEVRAAGEDDFEAIAELVNRYIETTTYNFRLEPQTTEDWIEEWAASHQLYPWLVAVSGDSLLGIAYAGRWKARAAYDWCAEVTIYVAPESTGKGIGRLLFARLLALLDAQGYTTQISVIGLPNDASVVLQEAFGFECRGILRGVGYKHGIWLDVGFWQRGPRESKEPPGPIRPVADVLE